MKYEIDLKTKYGSKTIEHSTTCANCEEIKCEIEMSTGCRVLAIRRVK